MGAGDKLHSDMPLQVVQAALMASVTDSFKIELTLVRRWLEGKERGGELRGGKEGVTRR